VTFRLKRNRRPGLLSRLCAVVLILVAAADSFGGEGRHFTDQLGRRLQAPDDPQRVVALAESVTEIVFAVGRGDRLVGTTRFADYPQAALKLPRIGSYIQLDIERIAALRPDLCIGTRDGNPKAAIDRLDALGIPVYISNPMGIESILQSITEIGALMRAEEAAAALVSELHRRIAAVTEVARRSDTHPTVFFQIGVDPIVSAGRGTFIHELIEAAGGVNAAGEAAAYPKYSPEQLVRLAPDVVVITTMTQGADFDAVRREWLRWPRIPAVRDGRVHVVDAAVFNRPAPRLIDGLEILARLIHPEALGSPP
jgi:iron complex transport system substrate-binding protein